MERPAVRKIALLMVISFVAGCAQSSVSATTPETKRSEIRLAKEPRGAIGVLDARKMDVDGQELTLVGRVGGVPNPWIQGYASFIISDLKAPDALKHQHAHGCDCKFCKQKHRAADSIAVVEIVDAGGRVVRTNAQQLLGLKTGHVVVVQGRARVDSLGCMTLSANRIYVRR